MEISKKRNITQDIYLKIKELIVYDELKPGAMITVGELAEKFKVSNTPIRDSLNALKYEGLIEVLPHKGYFVTRVDLKDLQELFQMRIILEGAAVELATKNINSSWINILTDLANADITSENNETKLEFMKINYNFHTAVAQVAGNQYLYKSIANVLDRLQRVLYADLVSGDPSTMQKEHLEVIQCIAKGDAYKARDLMVLQIEASKNRIFNSI